MTRRWPRWASRGASRPASWPRRSACSTPCPPWPRRSGRGRCRRPPGRRRLEWAPYGVVLGWHAANSPVWVPTLVAASALVGGNAVLARPSSRARATTGRVLAALAGPWPEGAVTVVDLPGPEAEPLVWDPGVHAVVTHASTRTCKRQLAGLGAAYAEGAPLRPYIPEGSGNDAMIVLEGADLEAAASAAALGGFANGGQLCMAAKRIVVERAAWEGFRPRLVEAVGGAAARRPRRPGDRRRPAGRGARPGRGPRGAGRGARRRRARCWWARASAGPSSRRRSWPCRARPSGGWPSGARRPSPRCAAWWWPRTPRTPWRSPTTPPSRSGRRSSGRARISCRACAPPGCS